MNSKSGIDEFTARLRASIACQSDAGAPGSTTDQSQFDQIARELFALQCDHNAVYRRFCDSRGASPQTIEHWTQIPAVPTQAFKEFDVSCLPVEERTSVFYSSGTTGQRPSRHFHNCVSLAVYETSLLAWFQACLGMSSPSPTSHRHKPGATGDWQLAILTPPPRQAPNSSLVHMFETIRRWMGAPESAFSAHLGNAGGWTLDLEATIETLERFSAGERPVLFLGPAFSFVHLVDHLSARNLAFALPAGSRALETGGYKGRSREVSREKLHALITERIEIAPEGIVGEYGMSELSSQAYDCVWNSGCRGSYMAPGARHPPLATRHFIFPPWARAQLVSPHTGQPVAEGETGLIRVFDLANVYSVMAIQTEDLGIRRGGGFELLGRAALAEPRGCSLMVA